MLLIFVEQTTERLLYTLNFSFKQRGVSFELTNDKTYFLASTVPKLNYSSQDFLDIPKITPCKLLFEEPIISYKLSKQLFFKEECLAFDNCMDPLASIFFVLTRMEEYLPFKKDKMGRYEGKNSIMFQFGWHEKVMCDRWSADMLHFIKSINIDFNFELKVPFRGIPTFDIDNTYAYKSKGILRTTLSILKDFFLGRSRRLLERQKVQAGLMKDPYDTFDLIEETAKTFPKTRVFWLLGDFAKFDKNISYKNKRQRTLIQRMNQKMALGIHPSVKSNTYEFFLHNEIERLEEITAKRIYSSRQHFLMLEFPQTYRTLVGQEIKHDYTMGFADIAGFRAGTARPFLWFDLHKNKCTSLTIHPFAYMDGTLNQYLKLNIDEAKAKISELVNEVRSHGGDFVFIWHNETIGNYGIWRRWTEVFQWTLDEIKKADQN
jgi:hypothetical protein